MTDLSALPYRPCAGVMLLNRKGQVFVGQRIDTVLEAWQMPQGGIDPGEDARAAALRELREETGFGLLDTTIEDALSGIAVFDHPDRSSRGRTITHAHFFDFKDARVIFRR